MVIDFYQNETKQNTQKEYEFYSVITTTVRKRIQGKFGLTEKPQARDFLKY
jgi:hypothetical protein